MFKRLISRKLDAYERDTGYELGFMRDLLAADLNAFMRFARFQGVSEYFRDVPADVFYAVRLVGTLAEDCGPCAQLMVTLAERAGVEPRTLRALIAGDDAALDARVRLAVRYARAVVARDPELLALRDEVIARWGKRGLISLAFGLVAARVFPTLKYALGHGQACVRVQVAGVPVVVAAQPKAAVAC